MDGLFEAQHDSERKRKLAENHAGNYKNIQFLNCSSLFKADLFHSLLHFGFNQSPYQCNSGSLLLVESGILVFGFWNLTLGFRNSSPGIWNPAAIKIRNPSSSDKESGIQYLEFRIHSVESRIKEFLGLPYMGRNEKTFIMRRVQRCTCACQSRL